MQSLIFSDFDKDKKVIDYRLPDPNNMILLLEEEFEFELDPKYTTYDFYTRLSKIFELFINKLLNIRKQYLEENYKARKSLDMNYLKNIRQLTQDILRQKSLRGLKSSKIKDIF